MSDVTTDTGARDEQADAALAEFVRRLPKAELHLHIEGTLEPELLLELGRRNDVELPCSSAEECRAQYRFSDLQHFLDIYFDGVTVLVAEQDFYDLTAAYVRRVAADGARHVEVFFDPQSHVPRGVPFEDVVGGITRALRDGETELGVSWRLIMCFLRDRPAAEAMEMLELALPHRDVIAGVGIDSAEVGPPAGRVRARCTSARGRRASSPSRTPARRARPSTSPTPWTCSRCGASTTGSPRSRTPRCSAASRSLRVPLTMCPLSNLELQVTPDLSQHPLKKLLDAGLVVTVNSDDPAYFDGYLLDNYLAVAAGAGPEPRRPGPAGAQLDHGVTAPRRPQGRAHHRDRPRGGRELRSAGGAPGHRSGNCAGRRAAR